MVNFILGISITLNVVFIIGIVIFLSVKNNVANKFMKSFEEDNSFNNSSDEIVDKESAKDFLKDEKVDFSSLLKR